MSSESLPAKTQIIRLDWLNGDGSNELLGIKPGTLFSKPKTESTKSQIYAPPEEKKIILP